MTALAEEDETAWPEGILFWPGWQIPFQTDYIARMYLMGTAMLAADMGTGKCQPVTEPVLTPAGWRPIGDLVPGDEVIGRDGQPTKVLSVHPQSDRRVYRIEMNDGSWTLAGPEHLWSVQDNNGMQRKPGEWQVLTTQQIIDRGVTWGGRSRNPRWRVPVTAPVQYPERAADLPVDPYVLGAWLGDGHSYSGGFTSADDEIIEQIRAAGHEVTKCPGLRYGWYIRDLMVDLRELGVIQLKHIPEAYLRASEEARLAVLQGLLDTDGYADPRQAGIEFCTTLPALRDAVVDLVQGLGGIARVGKTKKTVGKDAYRVGVKLPPHMPPFRLSRKLETWTPASKYQPGRRIKSIDRVSDQECVCITVAAEDELYLTRGHIVTHNSVMALGVAGLAFEQQAADRVLIVCEPNKLAEWPADVARFTRLSCGTYHGPKRKKLLDGLPQVLVTTYETCRDDVAVFPPKGSRSRTLRPGPLMQALAGQRVLVVYDEITKLGRRSSNLYKAHHWMMDQLRKGSEHTRAIGMSGTPMETDLENIYNEMRVLIPSMPLVKDFEENVIRSRHPQYGTPAYTRNGREWLRQRTEPWILRKRKSDPDVQAMFPPLTEEFRRIRMRPDQYRVYQLLEDLAWDRKTKEHRVVPGLNALLRQLAGDPGAVLLAAEAGDSKLAVMVAEEMRDELEACSSAKADELISMADQILAAGHKMMVFTFFGQTVLPAVVRRLGDRPVFTYHGGLTQAEREHQKTLFKAVRGGAILVSSDAGARGINMPELDYIAEYEAARTHATRLQRAARGHRLGKQDPLSFITLVLESSIEGASAIRTLMRRNDDQDYILGDNEAEGYVTADDRRELFAQARPRKAG